jgi:EAL domain-containing protein (putative c-di-GMP-specific phosphodiesterase class I)/DNA-binding NarL/FixJ family response regulator
LTPTRVAIVDDDASVCAVLAEVIEDDETLELAGTADEVGAGIELIARERPNVALVDVKMPGGGGPRATAEMLERSPETRVIALSAHVDRHAVLEMLRVGAIAYLVKGCPVEELVETIHQAAQGRGTLASEVTADVVDELASHLGREAKQDERVKQRTKRIRSILDDRLLRMVYQPIVDIESRKTIGFEALARFPEHYGVRPDVWFADAEETGLGEELELAAVELALENLTAVPPDGFLSVNLSPETAMGSHCAELLGKVQAGRVVVEMTEHAAVEDYELLRNAVERLSKAGIRIAVDDTGAGFASLRHIIQLSPAFIKLDVSLTRGIHKDKSRRALAAALSAFANELGASIIAEGVEKEEELDVLRTLGVPYAQGYLLGRPGALVADALVG